MGSGRSGVARLGEHLVAVGRISGAQLEEALECQVAFGGRLGTNLVELGYLSLDDLAETLSMIQGVALPPDAWLSSPAPNARAAVPESVVKQHSVLPLRREQKRLHVAMLDPHSLAVISDLEFASGCRIEAYILPELRMFFWLEKHYGIARDVRYINVGREMAKGRFQEPVLPVAMIAPEPVAVAPPPPMPSAEIPRLVYRSTDLEIPPPSTPATAPKTPPPPRKTVEGVPAPSSAKVPPASPPIVMGRPSKDLAAGPVAPNAVARPPAPSAPRRDAGAVARSTAGSHGTPPSRPDGSQRTPPPAGSVRPAVKPPAPPPAMQSPPPPGPPDAPPLPPAKAPPPATVPPPAAAPPSDRSGPPSPPAERPIEVKEVPAPAVVPPPVVSSPSWQVLASAWDALEAAEDRPAVIEAGLSVATQFVETAALFVVHQGLIRGDRLRTVSGGPKGVETETRGLSAILFPVSTPGFLSRAVSDAASYQGAPDIGPADARLLRALGRPDVQTVAVWPVMLAGRIVNLLYADHGARDMVPIASDALAALAQHIGAAYERLIRQKKKDMGVAPSRSGAAGA